MRKIAIIYGRAENGLQKRALEELTRILLEYTVEYPLCYSFADGFDTTGFLPIYIGTKENNPYIEKNSGAVLTKPEEYFIKVEKDSVIIEGFDDAGALYGAIDFYNKYITLAEHPEDDRYWINPFEQEALPCFELTSAPDVKERGLWTWGHVIYDYRGYFDNMLKLKMNSVVIWNDYVPMNAHEIVEYAHSVNVKVIWGFAWLWDTSCNRVDIRTVNTESESQRIFAKYEKEYAGIGGDGIYFQTFTELKEDNIGGILIAEAAAAFVNSTAALFYGKYPDMEIQFGLHATSVEKRLEFIKTVNPKIRIVWEDCGAFPFSYIPDDVESFPETLEFVGKIANLRGEGDRFGVVTKGLVKLDWTQFEHLKGSHLLGVSTKTLKENRIARKRRIWRYIQAGWLANSGKALLTVSEMCRIKRGELSVLALVEDGMFEENIMYPVALFSEMLWDSGADINALMCSVALRSYVTYA